MRKFVFIIVFNTVIFAVLYFVLGFIVDIKAKDTGHSAFLNFINNFDNLNVNLSEYQTESMPDNFIRLENNDEKYKEFCGEERRLFNNNYVKHPIIVLGCSYAYGHGLKKQESFSYLLSEYTNRPVLNYSQCGYSLLSSLSDLYDDYNNNYKNLINDSEYIIYVYMYDHINRYLSYFFMHWVYPIMYNHKNIIGFFDNFKVFRYIFFSMNVTKILQDYPNIEGINLYLKNIIINANEKLKKIAPNAKFIIVIYDEKMSLTDGEFAIKFNSDIINSNVWKEIEQETDIKIVRSSDITGFYFDKNYKLNADIAGWHPNAKAWSVFTKKFAHKYIN